MIWLAPWVLVGLLAVGLPIAIHFLVRGRAKTQSFPTLRFIVRSRLLPTRRMQLNDLLLLLVRVTTIASAAVALAQPYWSTAGRREAFEQTLARAIILDTSASVHRVLAVDSGRALVARLATDANVSVLLTSSNVVDAVPGALAWLAQNSERRELVIVSDFQVGVVDARTIAQVPAEVGVRLLRVGTGANAVARSEVIEARAHFGPNAVSSRSSFGTSDSAATSVDASIIEWSVREDVSHVQSTVVRVLSGLSEQARINAALTAAIATTGEADVIGPVADSTRSVVIVTRGFEQRASMLATARVPRISWMLETIARISHDATLIDAAADDVPNVRSDSSGGLVIARSSDGRPLVRAFESTIDAHPTLMLVDDADAGSLTTAALISAARNAMAPHNSLSERDPAQLPDSVLRGWQRMPSAQLRPTTNAAIGGAGARKNGSENSAPNSDTTVGIDSTRDCSAEHSDGRWLWLFALALLVVETWLRRSNRSTESVKLSS